ncbi:hypothetical protein THAOC_22411 [Thalassiosira oceanica]|uniref:Uncharacterized protein n=1 Tax=Thalassiosira oceanica TaxID=159749 RepID=K0RYH9_THAOC|nr:hypothetical protein THAOC_22411 [Thalassiosira oceanica]|eukprot:EJK57534.1 hypothetical protein THAOC_22411 [Thalassiosira oceanica]
MSPTGRTSEVQKGRCDSVDDADLSLPDPPSSTKTSANSTWGENQPCRQTTPPRVSSDPTATSARSSATSFLAKGPASPCPRSRTDRKPTSPTSAPPRTPPPLMS